MTTQRKPRFSSQRELVKKIVHDAKCHLSADETYARAKKMAPTISRGTVYRNLHQLEELKEVISMRGEGQVYYEKYQEPHHHFICEKCGMIENLVEPNVSVCTGCIKTKFPHQVNNVVTSIYGVCEGCQLHGLTELEKGLKVAP